MTTTSQDALQPPQPLDHLRYFAFDQQALRCPQAALAGIRETEPITFVDAVSMYVVTSFELVDQIMRTPKVFSSHLSIGPNAHAIYDEMLRLARESGELQDRIEDYAAGPRHVLINADPPDHQRHRSLISHAFTPARVRKFEPEIRRIADRLIDDFAGEGQVELVARFTEQFTMHVVRLILGVPEEDMPRLREWADAFGRGVGTVAASQEELVELAESRLSFDEYFTDRVAERRAAPTDDLVSDIVRGVAGAEERPLSEDELLAVFQQLVLGGNATIGSLINDCLVRLIREPQWRQRLQRDQSGIADFVEEVMRHAAPVQAMFRQATEATEVGGVEIPAGSIVYCSLAAASRDPKVFPDPDEFAPGRGNVRRHLGLGIGPHFCIGAHLGRAEARIALERFLSRFAEIRPAAGAETEFVPSIVFHTPATLDAVLVPRADQT